MALWLRVNPPEVGKGERDVLLPLSSSSSSIHLPGALEDGNGTEGSVLLRFARWSPVREATLWPLVEKCLET